MREHIAEEQLTDAQRQVVQQLLDTDLKALVNDALRDRGIPLEVYRIQMAAGPAPKDLEASLRNDDWPPPGGCYCCVDGACYCC
jgi:hypothetical protein